MKIKDFELERFFAKWEFKAPYLLCCSDCESFTIDEVLHMSSNYEDAKEKLLNQWLGYCESTGHPMLREEISKIYKSVKSDDVLVFAGAEEAIFIFFNALLTKDDHIIVHYPCYQSLFEVANSIGCEVTKWETSHQNQWQLDLDFLKQSIKPNTKAIIVNTPHNPTGFLIPKDTYTEIVEIAKSKNITLFSDEVYKFLEYDVADRLTSGVDLYDNAVSLGVMSKSFGLAGLRIGWVATKNKELLNRMAAFKDYTSICNSAPSENLAILALQYKEKLAQRNLEIVKHNIGLLNTFFEKYSKYFQWVAPKAGALAFPTIVANVDVKEFCEDLIEKKGVLLLPSTAYSFGNKNFRLGFGRKNMPEALGKLEEYLEEGHFEKLIK